VSDTLDAKVQAAILDIGDELPPLRFWDRFHTAIIGVVSVAAFFVAWQVVAGRWIDPLFISAPTRIAAATVTLIRSGELWRHLSVSLHEFVVGFALAIITGVAIGVVAGWYGRVFAMLNPFIVGFNATPRVALLPLIVIWLGVGIWSKVAIVYLGAVFPIIFNMMTAMRTMDASILRMARSFGASDRHIFRTIALPSSVPFLIAGLRLGSGRALVGIVVGELYAANVGIGYLIAIFGSTFQTDKLFVGVMIITALGVALDVLLRWMERRFELWRPKVGT
jgi:NitT/TauT family transport system permease protein